MYETAFFVLFPYETEIEIWKMDEYESYFIIIWEKLGVLKSYLDLVKYFWKCVWNHAFKGVESLFKFWSFFRVGMDHANN